jgi:hypothetical protein
LGEPVKDRQEGEFVVDDQGGEGGVVGQDLLDGAGGAGPGAQALFEAMQGGTYAVISLVIDSNGTPDYAKGMVADFTVSGQATPQDHRQMTTHRAGRPLYVL